MLTRWFINVIVGIESTGHYWLIDSKEKCREWQSAKEKCGENNTHDSFKADWCTYDICIQCWLSESRMECRSRIYNLRIADTLF